MTKISLVMMMCLLFTSSLVCTMNACPVMTLLSENQAPENDKSKQELCHTVANAKSVNLVVDCMDMDLFQNEIDQQLTGTQNPDNQDFNWDVISTHYQFQREHFRDIRGPPYLASHTQLQIPLLLSTLRFRI